MIEQHVRQQLERKQAELRRWLNEHAPAVEREQRHLQDGSPERAYWHYGYYVALSDLRALISGGS